jgi:hypothetical protein
VTTQSEEETSKKVCAKCQIESFHTAWNAGTHNHRWLLFDASFPQAAATIRITATECMGPGFSPGRRMKARRVALAFLNFGAYIFGRFGGGFGCRFW